MEAQGAILLAVAEVNVEIGALGRVFHGMVEHTQAAWSPPPQEEVAVEEVKPRQRHLQCVGNRLHGFECFRADACHLSTVDAFLFCVMA